jgi:hypothetical protein
MAKVCFWQNAPNKAWIGRWGFCAVYKHFAQRGFGFFLLPNRIHARSHAGKSCPEISIIGSITITGKRGSASPLPSALFFFG